MAPGRTDAIIAGVNKAGTTSLFVSLSTHPDVAPSSIKETRFFLPRVTASRCRRPPSGTPTSPTPATGPCTSRRRRRTSTAARPSPRRCATGWSIRTCWSCCASPVSRAISFFTLPEDPAALPRRLPDHRLPRRGRPAHRRRLPRSRQREVHGVPRRVLRRLPPGLARRARHRPRAHHRLRRLVGEQVATLHDTATWLGLDPARFPADALSSENRTTGYKSQGLPAGRARRQRQARARAAAPPDIKRRLRAFYYRLNGRPAEEHIPDSVRAELAARYEEPNARLAQQLDAAGIALPGWLSPPTRSFRRHRRRIVAPPRRRVVDRGEGDEHERALEHERHRRGDGDAGDIERVPSSATTASRARSGG